MVNARSSPSVAHVGLAEVGAEARGAGVAPVEEPGAAARALVGHQVGLGLEHQVVDEGDFLLTARSLARPYAWSRMGHDHSHSHGAGAAAGRCPAPAAPGDLVRADRGVLRGRGRGRVLDQQSWPCCPTPGTCSPTSSAWGWRSPRSSSPPGRSCGARTSAHLRSLPAGDPGRLRERPAPLRRGRLGARRGRPPLRRPARRRHRADAGRRRAGAGGEPGRLRPPASGGEGEHQRRGRLPRGRCPTRSGRSASSSPPGCWSSRTGAGSTPLSAPPSASSSSPGPGGSGGRPVASSSRRPRRTSTSTPSPPTWRASRGSSTSTTSTSGR